LFGRSSGLLTVFVPQSQIDALVDETGDVVVCVQGIANRPVRIERLDLFAAFFSLFGCFFAIFPEIFGNDCHFVFEAFRFPEFCKAGGRFDGF